MENEMPFNLIIVRHGESVGNLAKRMSEQGDNSLLERLHGSHTAHWPLTKKGVKQAEDTGAFLNAFVKHHSIYFQKMYVSSYARALQTASALNLDRGEWIVDTRITERDWGDLDRMTEDERHEKFGEAIQMRSVEPFFWAPPNGESFNDLIIRVRDFVDSLARARSLHALVVCHGEVMKAFRIIFQQLTPSEYKEMEFSKDPLKRIHNCQIDHYTRLTSDNRVEGRFSWLHIYRPAEDSMENRMKMLPRILSTELPRKRFNSLQLAQMAEKLSEGFSGLGL